MTFLRDYFDKEKSYLTKFYLLKKGNKKAKSFLKKLNMLDIAIRDKILKAFVHKCIIDYGIKFSKWR